MALDFPSNPGALIPPNEWVDDNGVEWHYDPNTNSWTAQNNGSAATAFNFRGGHDFTDPTVPNPAAAAGDLFVHDGADGAINAVYPGINGAITYGQLVLFDGSEYVLLSGTVPGYPNTEDGDGETLDLRYVKKAGDNTAQVITGTGGLKTEGLLESNGGVAVRGQTFAISADGNAPSFFQGSTYIGGTTARNTFDLWKSTLTEEQLEQLEAGTLVAPANVSLPGDGSFARQWYYDQQDAETQALLDSGELEYPTHLAAATFTDTFDLGDNTKINLNSTGLGVFKGGAIVNDGFANQDNEQTGFAISSISTLNRTGISVNLGGGSPTKLRPFSSYVAASGSIGDLIHFNASQDSASTYNQVKGFAAQVNLQNATTAAYGFWSNLDVGNGKNYNFYAEGTAPNYFAGQLFAQPNSLNTQYWTHRDRGFLKTYSPNNAIVSTGDASYAPLQVSVGDDFSTTKHLFSVQSGAGVGSSIVTAAGGDLAFNNTSDYRIKTDIQDYNESAANKIKNLRLVSYTRTDFNIDVPIGFLAHELQTVVPEAVFGEKDAVQAIGTYTDPDGNVETEVAEPEAIPYGATWTETGTRPVYQGVDQTKLIPLLTKALQEALERIEALESAGSGY